jgi:hypothetical protein
VSGKGGVVLAAVGALVAANYAIDVLAAANPAAPAPAKKKPQKKRRRERRRQR